MVVQIDEIARVVREVLGEAVIGIYLEGSAVVGGLRPRSDIDVFAVTSRSATVAERGSLVDRLMAISDTGGPEGRPVELTIVVQADVRPWQYAPMRDFQYGEWVRADYERGALPVAEPDADLALLMTGVLTADRALFGPPPAAVLDPVPPDDVRRATLDAIPGILLDLDADTRNGILTLARIWTTVATGTSVPRMPPRTGRSPGCPRRIARCSRGLEPSTSARWPRAGTICGPRCGWTRGSWWP